MYLSARESRKRDRERERERERKREREIERESRERDTAQHNDFNGAVGQGPCFGSGPVLTGTGTRSARSDCAAPGRSHYRTPLKGGSVDLY